MSLAGPGIFTPKILNLFLNTFVKRLSGSSEYFDKLTTAEVFQFLELLVVYLRANSTIQF